MPLDNSQPGGPLDWLSRAKGNLSLAKQPRPEGAFWEDQCFLTQQAAEKAIKAVYQYKQLFFRFTHDLEELCKGLEDCGVPIPVFVKESIILTRYAVETRYPGLYEPLTEEEYKEAIRLAEGVIQWAESLIQGMRES